MSIAYMKPGKRIILILDINDGDYVAQDVAYSDSLYTALQNASSKEDIQNSGLEIEYFGDDIPHTLESFYLIEVINKVDKTIRLED